MTPIDDVILDADGSPAEGQVTLFWPQFMAADGTAITQGQRTYEVSDGKLKLSLYPTVSAQPNGSYYTAQFELTNGSVYDEYWLVPDQAASVKLNTIRAMFPPSPGIFINSLQITGGNAKVGNFLGWNGNQWVPMSVTTINISPNTIGLTVRSDPGADISVPGDSAVLGAGLTLNIPDADAAMPSRGVVNTGVQSFAGVKTFQDGAAFGGLATFANGLRLMPSSGPTSSLPPWGSIWFDSQNTFNLIGGFSFRNPDGSHATLEAGDVWMTRLDLTRAVISNTVASPQSVIFPGQESILFGGNVAHGIGVDVRDWLWLGSGQAFAALRPDAAWVTNWIDLSPYQHPIVAGTEASPSQASIVLYQDVTQWIGMGVDNAMRLWFRIGPNGAGTYYYLHQDGGSLGVYTWVDNTLVAQRAGINLIAGQHVTITASDNLPQNTVDVVINAAGNLVDPTTHRGDLITRDAQGITRLPAIYDGEYRVLTCDPWHHPGLSWTVGVPTSRRIIAGAGLWGGGDLSKDVDIWASVLSVFGRTGNITLTGADIINAGGVMDPTLLKGDLIVRSPWLTVNRGLTRLGTGIDGSVLVADSTLDLGMRWVPGAEFGAQTPWIMDIDGAGYTLFNVGLITSVGAITAVGQLGIGTATPAHELDVVGDGAVSGDFSVGGDLNVAGATNLSGDLGVDGNFTVAGTSTLTGDVGLGADLAVAGNSTLDGNLDVAGGGVVAGDFGVGGDSTLTGTLSVVGHSALGDLSVIGATDFTGDVLVTGDTALTGAFAVTGDSALTGDLAVDGNFSVTGTSTLTGDVAMAADLTVAGSTTMQDLTVTGALITGATVIHGDLEATGDLDIAGDSTLGGDLDVVGNTTLGGTLAVAGASTFASDVSVTGDTALTGDFSVTGNTALTGAFDVTGDSSFTGDVAVSGELEVATISSGSTTPVVFAPPLEAGQIDLNPDIQSWGNVQAALAAIDNSITTLSRGMSYVGSYDAANDVATFVPSLASLNGSLPAADATGLEQGDFLIATSDSAGPPLIQMGDQLISGGSSGGANWDILSVGHVAITASMVAVSPQVGSWTTVQQAIQDIFDGGSQTPWLSNIDADGHMLVSGSTSYALTFGTGLVTAPTERMRIASNGNVGIGRTAPAAMLDVNGNVMINATLYTPASTNLTLGAGATTARLTILSTGNVGIGTASPSALLHVAGNAMIASTLYTASTSLMFGAGSTTARMTITTAGNVGIGNNGATVSHSGTAIFLMVGSISDATPGSINTVATVPTGDSGVLLGAVGFANNAFGGETRMAALQCWKEATGVSGSLRFYTSAGSLTERARIAPGGFMGIGNTNPQYRLDVSGDINISSGSVYRINTVALNATLIPLSPAIGSFTTVQQAVEAAQQTPWQSNINANNFILTSGATTAPLVLATGTAASPSTTARVTVFASGSMVHFWVGSTADGTVRPSSTTGYHMMLGNALSGSNTAQFTIVGLRDATANDGELGGVQFANYTNTAVEKRIAMMQCRTATSFGGFLTFWTSNAGTFAERWRITADGMLTAYGGNLRLGTTTVARFFLNTSGHVWIGQGSDASTLPGGSTGVTLVVGRTDTNSSGQVCACVNSASASVEVGAFKFANYAITDADKRVAALHCYMDGQTDSARLGLWTKPTGAAIAERVRITSTGQVGVGNIASLPTGIPADPAIHLILGPVTAGGGTPPPFGRFVLACNHSVDMGTVGEIVWSNYNAGNDRRNAIIQCILQSNTNAAHMLFYTSNGGTTSPLERMRITKEGRVGIGQTTPTYSFQLGTDSAAKPGTNTWTIVSDIRAKRDVEPFEGGMETVRQLEPVVAKYNGKAGMPDGMRVVSLDPLKLRELIPGAVSSVRGELDGEDADILGVNTHEVFYHMLRAIQQLDREVRELKEKSK